MSSRPAKRARSHTNTGAAAVDPSKIPELVDSIDSKAVAKLLITAAKTYPEIASLIQREVDRIAKAERAKVLDFDYLSRSAWKTLNVTYDRLSGSQAFEFSGEAAREVEECFETIRRRCPKTANFKTKESALETLRKIGKSICLSNGVVGREIRKNYQHGGELVPLMLDIAQSLTDQERERLEPWCNEKLVKLQEEADGLCIFEDLGEVIDLWGDGDEEEEEISGDGNEDLEDDSAAEQELEDERLVTGMIIQKYCDLL
ncbi:hypothetical protein BDR22DRAFT_823726 [Usnea florida]